MLQRMFSAKETLDHWAIEKRDRLRDHHLTSYLLLRGSIQFVLILFAFNVNSCFLSSIVAPGPVAYVSWEQKRVTASNSSGKELWSHVMRNTVKYALVWTDSTDMEVYVIVATNDENTLEISRTDTCGRVTVLKTRSNLFHIRHALEISEANFAMIKNSLRSALHADSSRLRDRFVAEEMSLIKIRDSQYLAVRYYASYWEPMAIILYDPKTLALRGGYLHCGRIGHMRIVNFHSIQYLLINAPNNALQEKRPDLFGLPSAPDHFHECLFLFNPEKLLGGIKTSPLWNADSKRIEWNQVEEWYATCNVDSLHSAAREIKLVRPPSDTTFQVIYSDDRTYTITDRGELRSEIESRYQSGDTLKMLYQEIAH